jgi:hypothetical protein
MIKWGNEDADIRIVHYCAVEKEVNHRKLPTGRYIPRLTSEPFSNYVNQHHAASA